MKRKNRMKLVVISLMMLLFVTGCSVKGTDKEGDAKGETSDITSMSVNQFEKSDGNKEMSNEDIQKEIATFSYEKFEGEQEWKNWALLGNGQILSFGAPIPLYYTNLETNMSLPLCANPDCTHNNEDCLAIFSAHYGCDFVYCYDSKIYAASVVGNSIRIYRSDLDGKNHESVAYDVVEGNVDLSGYYVYEDCLYMSLVIEDTNKKMQSSEEDEGYMTYNTPCIYRFDFATGNLENVYQAEDGEYGVSVQILYGYDDVIYFTDGKEDGKVGALDIITDTVANVEGYDSGDYLGCHGNIHYYAEWDSEGFSTGNIHVENLEETSESTIHLTTLPTDEEWYHAIHLLENGFVINKSLVDESGNETGTMTFYDMSGEQTDIVENCSMYVIGEHQGLYLLAKYPYADKAEAYEKKDDVKIADSKVRNKKVVYLYQRSEE